MVDVTGESRRYRIKVAPIGGVWTKIRDEQTGRAVLGAIRARVAEGYTIDQAAGFFTRRPTEANRIPVKLAAFLERERARLKAGDISPRTVRELARFCGERGEFSYWRDEHIHEVTFKRLEQWRTDLGKRVGPKTARNVLGEFHRFLKWLVRCGDLERVPEFPEIRYERKAPKILFPDEQRAVLDAIAFEHRGVFLAMAHTLRPGEARGANLDDWIPRQRAIHVRRACKGLEAAAPVLGAKESNWRLVGADDDLAGWIDYRLGRATAAEKLRRSGVPLFPNWRAPASGRWSHAAITWEWQRACKIAGVEGVSVYPGTKHSTSTDLFRRGVDRKTIQHALGHKDDRSTEHYVVLADADTLEVFRRRTD